MVVRIGCRGGTTGRPILVVEGRLAGEGALLVERECEAVLGSSRRIALDLSGVPFVDRSGVDVLRRLSLAGVAIGGCSELIASVLESEGIRVEPHEPEDDRPERR